LMHQGQDAGDAAIALGDQVMGSKAERADEHLLPAAEVEEASALRFLDKTVPGRLVGRAHRSDAKAHRSRKAPRDRAGGKTAAAGSAPAARSEKMVARTHDDR